jgi:plastocyanin
MKLSSLSTRKLQSVPLLGIVLFIFSTSFPPLDLLAQINLPVHMGQHVLIALSGVFIAYSVYLKRKAAGIVPRQNYAIASIFVIAVIVTFWHLPVAWDTAVLNPTIHAVEHFSFFAVGLLIGWFFPVLPTNVKFMSVFLAASGHMVYGIFLLIMNTPVYPLYPVSQQAILGIAMLFPSPLYFIGLMVASLHNETKRLESLDIASGHEIHFKPSSTHSPRNRSSLGRVAVSVAMILLIAVFVGYLVLTVGMIYFPSAAADPPQGSINQVSVYILETPLTWQYSPQNIVVVIGINNSVVWISHSLSEDTVSSTTGLFDSGIMRPGQTWSYTFSTPGVYHYRCDFHPWMQGTVTVLASSD